MKLILTARPVSSAVVICGKLNEVGITDIWAVDTPATTDGIANFERKEISRLSEPRGAVDRARKESVEGRRCDRSIWRLSDTTEMDRSFLNTTTSNIAGRWRRGR